MISKKAGAKLRKITNQSEINIDGQLLPINTGNGEYYCYVEPLESIKRELDTMLLHHNKVFIFRLDIHVHEYSPTNEPVTNFRRSFVKWLKSHYGMKRVGYVWCREVETAKKQHYHLLFMLDGDKVNRVGEVDPKKRIDSGTYYGIFERIEHIASIQNLTVSLPTKKPSYMIKRADLEKGNFTAYDQVFYRSSYLAKERGKKLKAERANSFSTSRIVRPKNKRISWQQNELFG